jgi:hypothetical protein
MASSLFRMFELLRDDGACRLSPACNSIQFIVRGIVPTAMSSRALQFLASVSEPVAAKCVSYPGTARAVKVRTSNRYSSQPRSGEIPMTITVAHISPIISVIAGLLILIMPRLLNLVVAIYLILNGLIGLGLLKWLHM